MNRLSSLFLLTILGAFFSCSNEVPSPAPTPVVYDCTDNPDACQLAAANNSFGFKLFQALHQTDPDQNVFISPLSISTALSMTLNGADGLTKTEMEQTLEQVDLGLETVNGAYQYVLNALPQLDPEVQLTLANSIWQDLEFGAYDPFLATNQEFYQSEVQALDFKDPASVTTINDWIKANTGGKIEEVIESIPANAVMYLINAIYFKGDWRFPFDPENTNTQDFTLADNSTMPVQMMRYDQEMNLPFYANSQIMMVDLPYGDSTFSMSLILPQSNVELDEVIANLSEDTWTEWTDGLYTNHILLQLPKFKMSYEKKLNEVLKSMGMNEAFDQVKANFSKLGPGSLYISLVKHNAVLEVNEEGSEAAAVTVVEISDEAAAPALIFNRPFLLVIRENRTNSVLFLGKVMEPGM